MKFFGLGLYKMASIEKTVMDGGLTPTLHGLNNRRGNASMNNDTKASLNMFLETLKDEAEPHASKVVRLTTGLVLKDDDDNIELPSSYTKRRLYCRWCWERGWDIRLKGGNGSYGKVKDCTRRVSIPGTSDDVLWPVDSVFLPMCTMASFSSFWKEHHPLLIIKKSSHDTCGVCYLFSNTLNGLKRREVQEGRRGVREERLFSGVREVELDEDDGGETFELEEVDEVGPLRGALVDALSAQVTRSVDSAADATDDFDKINDERDKLILEMTEHVKECKAQREVVRERAQE
jgi:hypothetical protein